MVGAGRQWLCLVISLVICCNGADVFDESLHVLPITDKLVLALFEFDILSSRNGSGDNHFNLFPNALVRIFNAYNVASLKLTMTQGLWQQSWGYYSPTAPTGAFVYASFANATDQSIDANWRQLVQSLSGLFCASFSQIDSARSFCPAYEVFPDGHFEPSRNRRNARFGVLPNENVCTENLTPWKKLLPCKQDRGFVALLNAKQIFNSQYSSMGVYAESRCHDINCEHVDYRLKQTITVVFHPQKNAWDVESLFGKRIEEVCSIASSSVVIFKVLPDGDNSEAVKLSSKFHGSQFAALSSDRWLNHSEARLSIDASPVLGPSISLTSRVYGLGFNNLSFIHVLENKAASEVVVLFRQVIPWFLRIYFHTLRFQCEDVKDSKFRVLHYQPARDRVRPYHMELGLTLPQNGVCSLMFEFDKLLLRWTEYPPDAHHGFKLPAASIQLYLPKAMVDCFSVSASLSSDWMFTSAEPIQLFGEQVLVYLPTPDFSMPYNALCLVCTVLALSFGPVHNMTTRRFVIPNSEKLGTLSRIFRLLRCMRYCLQWLQQETGDAQ